MKKKMCSPNKIIFARLIEKSDLPDDVLTLIATIAVFTRVEADRIARVALIRVRLRFKNK